MSQDNTKISIQYQQYEYSLRNSHIPGIIFNITVKVVMFRGYVSDAFRCEHWPHCQLSLRHGVCSSYELRSFRTSSSTAVGQSCGIEMHPSHPFLMAKWRESFDIHRYPLNSFRKNAANSAQQFLHEFFCFPLVDTECSLPLGHDSNTGRQWNMSLHEPLHVTWQTIKGIIRNQEHEKKTSLKWNTVNYY